jgi:hypothetical protein
MGNKRREKDRIMAITSTKWARRGLLVLAARIAASTSALVALSKLSVAATKSATATFIGQMSQEEAEASVKAAPDLGFLFMVGAGAQIEALAVGDGELRAWQEGQEPPIDATGDVRETTIRVAFYGTRLSVIRCSFDGKVVELAPPHGPGHGDEE